MDVRVSITLRILSASLADRLNQVQLDCEHELHTPLGLVVGIRAPVGSHMGLHHQREIFHIRLLLLLCFTLFTLHILCRETNSGREKRFQ